MWHGYFGIENLGLDDEQRSELIAVLRRLGPSSDRQPARLNHRRTRLDQQAAIFEALFDEAEISIDSFKQRIAAIYGISWVTIGHSTNLVTFGELESAVVTFSRSGVDYIRVVFFGYDGAEFPTWLESGAEARAYIAANLAEWETDL